MTFYEKVFNEYNEENKIFICESSLIFEKAWNSELRLQILYHSKLYLESTRNMGQYREILLVKPITKGLSMFKGPERNLRVNFLKFCVDNKLDLV